MPRYVVVREIRDLSEEEIEAAGARLKAAEDEVGGIRWIRSYDADEKGKVYCEYEAPSMKALFESSRRAGFSLAPDAVTQVLEPGMFR